VHRGIYHKGWMAVTRHGNLPWVVVGAQPPLSDDVWELYDTSKDWSQARNLAAQMPEKVAELKRLFDLEASKYSVFPLDDRKAERTNPDIAGRPQVVRGSTQLLFSGMRRLGENTAINVKTSRIRSRPNWRFRHPAPRALSPPMAATWAAGASTPTLESSNTTTTFWACAAPR